MASLKQRGVASAHLYGDKPQSQYSELNSFYLLIDKPEVYGLPANPVHPAVYMRGDYIRSAILALVALAPIVLLLVLDRVRAS